MDATAIGSSFSEASSQDTDGSGEEPDSQRDKPIMSSQIGNTSFVSMTSSQSTVVPAQDTPVRPHVEGPHSEPRMPALDRIEGDRHLGKRKRHSEPYGPTSRASPMVSTVRISTSLDGEARIRAAGEVTPSPPKSRMSIANLLSGPSTTLQRSRSATSLSELTTGTMPRSGREERGGLRRSLTGSRPWEFFCDGDARNVLAARTEQEQDGSAAGAISLIRSRSQQRAPLQRALSGNRQALGPKGNAHNVMEPSPRGTKKQKTLSRAVSSLARLQGTDGKPAKEIATHKNQSTKDTTSSVEPGRDISPSGDSDKENWVPGTQCSTRRPGGPTTGQGRPALKEATGTQTVGAAGALAGIRTEKSRQSRQSRDVLGARGNKENQILEMAQEDEEVAAFMAGTTAPAREEDLDCIQGLLSLSQGAWR